VYNSKVKQIKKIEKFLKNLGFSDTFSAGIKKAGL
jgi:hypothetical protein